MKTIRITVRAEAEMDVEIQDDDFKQLVEDDPAFFDPFEYGIDVDTTELLNGSVEVTDWERIGPGGRPVPDDHVDPEPPGEEAR